MTRMSCSSLAALMLDENHSALSTRVHQLICVAGVLQPCSPAAAADCVTDEGLLDMTRLERLLPDGDDSYDYFLQCSTALAPVFKQMAGTWSGQKQPAIAARGVFDWMCSPKLPLTAFTIVEEDKSTGPVLSLLLSTSLLERSLGDLYLTKGRHCPSMLKDLLVTPELQQLLGPTMIKLLRVVMGPPISLNLRNVVWHGFPSPGEVQAQYAYTLLSIMATIGKLLETQNISPRSVVHRPFVDFMQMTALDTVFPDITGDDLKNFEKLFQSSSFAAVSMKAFWQLAVEKYEQQRYGECTALLLPQLEHGMRRAFAAINKCPERVLTAENTVLFTTFDEILAKSLTDSSKNKLQFDLGQSYVSLLLDILAYPEGPRLRDRVSHGETDLDSLPRSVASYIMCTCAALCLVFLEPDSQLWKIDFLKTVHRRAQLYESVFHPVSVVKRQIQEVAESLVQWAHLQRAPPGEIESAVDWDIDAEDHTSLLQSSIYRSACHLVTRYGMQNATSVDLSSRSCLVHAFASELGPCVRSLVSGVSVHTLYRYSPDPADDRSQEEEVVGLLRRILAAVLGVSQQVQAACLTRHTQWASKQLRSRQRNTYRRMLDCIPLLSQGLRLVLLAVLCNYSSLDSFNARPAADRLGIIKFLKYMLQYCENQLTYTSLDRNKWEESASLTAELIDRTARL